MIAAYMGFIAAGRRIWAGVIISTVIAVARRFMLSAPQNDLEQIIFQAVRDVWSNIKRRLQISEQGANRPDS